MTVRDNPAEGRYELLGDGDDLLGILSYEPAGEAVAITHTEVSETLEGQGGGSTLVRGALDDLRAKGKQVLPFCPFTNGWISRHEDYIDLVPEARREAFGLA